MKCLVLTVVILAGKRMVAAKKQSHSCWFDSHKPLTHSMAGVYSCRSAIFKFCFMA